MKTIHLYGELAEKYGPQFTLNFKTPAEAVKALHVQLPGFREIIEGGDWHVIRGPLSNGVSDDAERLMLQLGEETEVHLLPAVQGAGSGGGLFMTVVGIALIAVGYFTFGTTSAYGIAMIGGGAGLAVGGIVSMTTKVPGANTDSSSSDDKASFLFSGPKNTSSQGVAIPVGFGRCRTGSIVVSAGLYAEELAI